MNERPSRDYGAVSENEPRGVSAMAMTLTNLDKTLLILALNSGNTLYLAPGESSAPVDDIELNGNRKAEKLAKNGLLKLTAVSEPRSTKTATGLGKKDIVSESRPTKPATGPGKKDETHK